MEKNDSQMKKGILEMCLLFLIEKEDLYGYELIKRMESGFPDVEESTFYAILRRLHSSGYTDTYLSNESNGPQRKYYRITEEGRAALRRSIADWGALLEAVRNVGICPSDMDCQ